MITYEPLWKTMKEKQVSQYRLITKYGILKCNVEDVMEFRMDNSEYVFPTPEMFEEHMDSASN